MPLVQPSWEMHPLHIWQLRTSRGIELLSWSGQDRHCSKDLVGNLSTASTWLLSCSCSVVRSSDVLFLKGVAGVADK